MRRAGLVSCLVPALLIGVVAVPASAATPTTLYVANFEPCQDNGPGTLADPFCDIQAAADVVQPGQTVVVGPQQLNGVYDDVHLTRSGMPGQPITFEVGLPWANTFNPNITIDRRTTGVDDVYGFWLDGVHDVTVTGFAFINQPSAGIEVSNSSDITIDHDFVQSDGAARSVHVTGTSHDVTISHNYLSASGDSTIVIDPGVARVTVARNIMSGGLGYQVDVNDATGTTITNNTDLKPVCQAVDTGIIAVVNGSSGTTIENNVLDHCLLQTPVVVVDAASAATTALDYNIVFDKARMPYLWAGTDYATAVDLASHTGQGVHDLNTDPRLDGSVVPAEHSPAVDSGDAGAPGFLATDFAGSTPEDDPLVANTGTGSGIVDRGAAERTDPMTVQGTLSAAMAPTGGTVTETLSSTQGWAPITGYLVDFGDGTQPVPTTGPTVQHVYTTTGPHVVTVTVSDSLGHVTAPTSSGVVTVVPPAPLVPRITALQVGGFEVEADATATTDAWNLVGATCDLGDGTGPQPMNIGTMACKHTYPHGGLYRITISVTDAGGNTASTSTLVDVPTNGFSSVPRPRFVDGGHICALCRGAQGIPVGTNDAAAPGLPATTNTAVTPVPLAGAARGVVARRHGCVVRGTACPATAM